MTNQTPNLCGEGYDAEAVRAFHEEQDAKITPREYQAERRLEITDTRRSREDA